MKTRFTTIDIKAALAEINKSDAIGLRLMNVYDIDNKTYLLRLVHGETKIVILVESGNRIHLTEYDWPKNMMPSGFSMKCRKHLKGRRLASVNQLGIDRIIDFTFGYDEAAYHLIVELYDRGNIILTDFEYTVLQLLRTRTDNDKDVKFAVREKYPHELAKQHEGVPTSDKLIKILQEAKPGENLKRILNPNFVYGPALLEHTILSVGLKPTAKVPQQFDVNDSEAINKLVNALHNAENILQCIEDCPKGYIVQKREKKAKTEETIEEELLTYMEFHPYFYEQHAKSPFLEFPSFNKCVDEFFSKLESQKIDLKAIAAEKGALKRLENVKDDHKKRLDALKSSQDLDTSKAELIEMNLPLVEQAIATINSAIANQIDWEEIEEIVKEAQIQMDPVASAIKSLKLNINQIVLTLQDIYNYETDESSDEDDEDETLKKKKPKQKTHKMVDVNIDLGLTAFANARNFHTKRRHAATKEEKTIQASKKALKSAEQKTKETLKEVQTAKMISKTRKSNWFEKFYWFISSENYLVVGGRDQQQNELLVKRYLRPGDLYVHADLHGASSVIIVNNGKGDIPPKTLNEAGTMAICYSAAWEARVVTSAWWVYHNQVSKTAPSGEYLTTGSFMIRGKKNYLPPSQLVMGFSVMFKLDESSINNHTADRKVRVVEDDVLSMVSDNIDNDDVEISLENDELDGDDDNGDEEPQASSSSTVNEVLQEGTTEKCHSDGDVEQEVCNSPSSIPPKEVVKNEARSDEQHSPSEMSSQQDVAVLETSEQDGETENGGEMNIKKETDDDDDDDDDEDDFEYPDTNIQLQHVGGGVFQLQRGESTYSNDGKTSEENKQEQLKDENRKPKLSKKQRREMKKQRKQLLPSEELNDDDESVSPTAVTVTESNNEKEDNNKIDSSLQEKKTKSPPQQPPAPPKRGRKKKLKKIKEKYKDQDEEDRQLMQQILQSAGSDKPSKKKGRIANKANKFTSGVTKQQQSKIKKSNLIATDILHLEEAEVIHHADVSNKTTKENDDEEEDVQENENANILDSLTGQPVEDDVLLYAITVCAPYSCMQPYKYKVKVTPGTGKRGRAAKSAVHMFLQAKEATDWEKDLLKSLKDVDISRNMPGKVKISAPNMQRVKKKK